MYSCSRQGFTRFPAVSWCVVTLSKIPKGLSTVFCSTDTGKSICTYLSNVLYEYGPGNNTSELSPSAIKLLFSPDPSSISTCWVCISLASGDTVPLKDACFVVKMSLKGGMYSRYIQSRKLNYITDITQSSDSYAFCTACLSIYEAQTDILTILFFDAFAESISWAGFVSEAGAAV